MSVDGKNLQETPIFEDKMIKIDGFVMFSVRFPNNQPNKAGF